MLKTPPFSLAPQIETDSVFVADLELCTCRLAKDSRWPWLILVPQVANVEELFELSHEEQATAMAEASRAAEILKALTNCTKINIAMIGNMVRQLHIHVVARQEGDANWPGPIWGYGTSVPYDDATASSLISNLKEKLSAQTLY